MSKFLLDKYIFVKDFLSGLCLKSEIILLLKKEIFNLNLCNIKIDKNNFYLSYKNKYLKILLKKKEIKIILFFKKKGYFLIPFKIIKIKSLFKLKIFLVKKRGMKGFDVLKKKQNSHEYFKIL